MAEYPPSLHPCHAWVSPGSASWPDSSRKSRQAHGRPQQSSARPLSIVSLHGKSFVTDLISHRRASSPFPPPRDLPVLSKALWFWDEWSQEDGNSEQCSWELGEHEALETFRLSWWEISLKSGSSGWIHVANFQKEWTETTPKHLFGFLWLALCSPKLTRPTGQLTTVQLSCFLTSSEVSWGHKNQG